MFIDNADSQNDEKESREPFKSVESFQLFFLEFILLDLCLPLFDTMWQESLTNSDF